MKDSEHEMREGLRVDGADHTALAVLRLRAVEPYGLGVHDADCVGEDLGGCADRRVRGHEAGEEGGRHVGDYILDRYAGLIEGRLYDGMVLPDGLELGSCCSQLY